MASSVLKKEDLPVNEITSNIRNLASNIKSSSIKNLRQISQTLSLSNRLDRDELQLQQKQKKISAQSMSSTTAQTLDRYQEGYVQGTVEGVQTGFNQGFTKGMEYGQSSVLEDIISSLSGKSPALIATVLGALGLEMLSNYVEPEITPMGLGQPMQGTLVTGYGGGTPFHVDTRFARDLPVEQQVMIFDSMAQQLKAEGRVAEMGQAGGVSGQRYPVDGTMKEKIDFLKRAQQGHHTQRGMAAMDYFIPKESETRFGKSAEYAPIPAPTVPGYKVQYWKSGQMAGYDIIDEKTGRVVGRTLHGDPKLSTLKPANQQTFPTAPTKIIEESIIEPAKKDKKVSALMQDMEPTKGVLVAYQPIQSQTVVNNQMQNGGGGATFVTGVPTDNRIITLAKSIS
jgi:hypothetical protein